MDKRLIRAILDRTTYEACGEYLVARLFSSDIKEIFEIIELIFKGYPNTSVIDKELLREVYLLNNPAITQARKSVMVNLITDICEEDTLDPALAKDFIGTIWRRENARLVAAEALKVINGESDALDGIVSTVASFTGANSQEEGASKAYTEIPFDLSAILERTSYSNLFPFRLPSLAERIPGAGRGNLVITFARPEVGKTAFTCYQAAGYLQQGLKVSYFMNEEPAYRVYMRLICSALECTEEMIRENPTEAKEAFQSYAANLRMHDAVGMDMSALDAYCIRNHPDVLILDQLDKFHLDGSFARDDLKLGGIYISAREIAKKYDCLVYGVSQASADAEGLRVLNYSMLAGSKTSKAAEADLIIGIGKGQSVTDDDPIRSLCISKNKINGFHGTINCNIDNHRCLYTV